MRSIERAESQREAGPAVTLPAILKNLAESLRHQAALAEQLATMAEQPGDDDPALDAEAAAKHLGCTASHVRKEIARGRIAAFHVGTWKVRRSALLRYERSLTRGGGA